ncbi:winged helix-turn-helix transcriptional regulator [Streptomyces sp. NPDC052109]|uniref:winged helix-turn-helix transcriptional regulator n=1 Tax=Streptomyces sp. NPDC052109 TaxID=3155527 RepID=UPI003437B1BA
MGDKWSMLVIGALAAGDARRSDLATGDARRLDLDTAIPAVSRRMLTRTLRAQAQQAAGPHSEGSAKASHRGPTLPRRAPSDLHLCQIGDVVESHPPDVAAERPPQRSHLRKRASERSKSAQNQQGRQARGVQDPGRRSPLDDLVALTSPSRYG